MRILDFLEQDRKLCDALIEIDSDLVGFEGARSATAVGEGIHQIDTDKSGEMQAVADRSADKRVFDEIA